MTNMVDSHCHLYYEPYINNIQSTISECKKHNINKLLSIGVNLNTSIQNIELAEKYKEIYCTVGIHPNSTLNANIDDLSHLENLAVKSKKIIGIGEVGLDYYREHDKNKQFDFFQRQIRLSYKLNLPIIIHTRDAEKDTLKIIKKHINNQKFIIHCFSGTKNFARECIDMGGYISFSGNITFKNAVYLREVCKEIDLNKILIETDSPFLAPHPFRGKKNHPSNVRFVCSEIAKLKNTTFDVISKVTTENFNKIFFSV